MSHVSLRAAIEDLSARDRVIEHLVQLIGPIRHHPRNPDGRFGALVRAIIFQQLAGNAAEAIHARVRATVRGPLTPRRLLAVSDGSLRGAGLSSAKRAALRDLSTKVSEGALNLDRSPRLRNEAIIESLTTVRGIGRWTAEMYLIFELRRLDVWPTGDLGVRTGYGLAWTRHPPPTSAELEDLGETYRPYRSIVARYCWEAVALARTGVDLRPPRNRRRRTAGEAKQSTRRSRRA